MEEAEKLPVTPEQEAEIALRGEVFNTLADAFPTTLGKEVSKAERETKDISDSTLTYGEVEFPSLA